VEFICNLNSQKWIPTNVYGPTTHHDRIIFTVWLFNLDTTGLDLWMILGDFNLMRGPENRNRTGGGSNNVVLFNSTIHHLDLEKIPLKLRAYTLHNMQDNPLLEKLDRIFTSADWTTTFLNTIALPLAKVSSDHIPNKVQIGTAIPRARIFIFEEYWAEFEGFIDTIDKHWQQTSIYKIHLSISQLGSNHFFYPMFKSLRHGLKNWSKILSQIWKFIDRTSYVIALVGGLDDQRSLSIVESNFRKTLKAHILKLLEVRILYWRNRAKIKWAKLGDENTKKNA
jgi:hypothetical protein